MFFLDTLEEDATVDKQHNSCRHHSFRQDKLKWAFLSIIFLSNNSVVNTNYTAFLPFLSFFKTYLSYCVLPLQERTGQVSTQGR